MVAGIPWLGFVIYPSHRLLKRRNVLHFAKRLQHGFDLFRAGRITFAELTPACKAGSIMCAMGTRGGCAHLS